MQTTIRSLELSSPAFKHEGRIPAKYTCDGQDFSLPLEWSPGPDETESYVLIMDDPDAPGGTFTHWVMWNIVGTRLREGIPAEEEELIAGGQQGTNSFRKIGYGGPCPPGGTHRYFVHIYALDRRLDLRPSTTKEDLLEAMESHILARGELMGTYTRRRY